MNSLRCSTAYARPTHSRREAEGRSQAKAMLTILTPVETPDDVALVSVPYIRSGQGDTPSHGYEVTGV